MKAVVFPAPKRFDVADVPDPTPAHGEVLLRVARAGLCGTDIHIHRNEYLSDFPLVPGHEFVGEVVELGPGVTTLRVGDRVAVDPNLDCLHCEFCRRQQNNQCLNWQGVGITRQGAFAELVAAPARLAYKVPDGIDDAAAAFIEPLSCVVHAMNRLRLNPGEDVLLFGAGPIGLLLMQLLARRAGGRVVAVDRQPDRLELASRLGATDTLLADGHEHSRLKDLAPHGFPIVADATGVPRVIERALDHLRPYGRYLQFGVAPRDATVSLRPFDLFKKDWTLLGSFALCYTFEPAIALLASGSVDVAPLVSHTLPLDRFGEGFTAFERGDSLKVHFTPTA